MAFGRDGSASCWDRCAFCAFAVVSAGLSGASVGGEGWIYSVVSRSDLVGIIFDSGGVADGDGLGWVFDLGVASGEGEVGITRGGSGIAKVLVVISVAAVLELRVVGEGFAEDV